MSDALSDIARDQARGRCYSSYLEAICVYLADPSEEKRQVVIAAASDTDTVRGGYFGSKTNFSDDVANLLEGLKNGDKPTWAKFLSSLCSNQHDYAVLRTFSPFQDRTLVFVNYGCGFVTLYGDIQPLLDSIIHDENMRTYDCDKYLVSLSRLDTAKAEVLWIKCGGSGPDIPTDRPRPA